MISRALLWLVCASAIVGALGCEDEPELPTTDNTILPKKKKAAASDAGTQGATPSYSYVYNPSGKRDPFRRTDTEGQSKVEETKSLCDDVLCQWDLSQLKLVAVVSGDSNPLAMVEDPQGEGHMLRRNATIGRRAGKVSQILSDCIVVVEYFKGPDEKVNANPIKLCINADEVIPRAAESKEVKKN